MATWTTPVTHVTGDVLAVNDWNGLANDVTFLYQRPYGIMYATIATTLANNTAEVVNLSMPTGGGGYGFSASGSSLVVPFTGMYLVIAQVGTTTETNTLQTYITRNSTQITTYGCYASTANVIVYCASGDLLGLGAEQSSGSAVNTIASSNSTYLHAMWIGPQ